MTAPRPSTEAAAHLPAMQRIVAEVSGVAPEAIGLSTRPIEDLGLSLMDEVGIVLAVEAAFGFTIRDDEAWHLETVGGWCAMVARRLAATPSPIPNS